MKDLIEYHVIAQVDFGKVPESAPTRIFAYWMPKGQTELKYASLIGSVQRGICDGPTYIGNLSLEEFKEVGRVVFDGADFECKIVPVKREII